MQIKWLNVTLVHSICSYKKRPYKKHCSYINLSNFKEKGKKLVFLIENLRNEYTKSQ